MQCAVRPLPDTNTDTSRRAGDMHTFRKKRKAKSTTDYEEWEEDDRTNTLNLFDVGDIRTSEMVIDVHGNDSRYTEAKEVIGTLSTRMGTGGGNVPMEAKENDMGYTVRRLTPLECTRLQGFPDDWLDIPPTMVNGRLVTGTDTKKYSALGNSIALPQWFWIVNRMKEYLGDGATMGSLFDGIGGFPLVWEETYGKGTAKWASEIEPFPIAVTMNHFPEGEENEK